MALAGVAAAAVERSEQIWTMTFGTDINGNNDYLVTCPGETKYAPTGVWDVNDLTGSDYVATNGSDKRVHTQWNNGSGLAWDSNFEFEIVFTLADGFATNSKWPVLAELSGGNGSLRFGPYTEVNNAFYVDGSLDKNAVSTPLTLTPGKHTATVTVYEGTVTLKLDGVVAQTGTLNENRTGNINNITLGGNSGGDYRMAEHVHSISAYTVVATPAVPEPTTATLSLLALAGLAARRRRK